MSKSIFVSCVHEDESWINNIKKWAANNLLGKVAITHETEDKRHLGDAAVKKHIEAKIRGAAIVLVLIGNDTHNHDWIRVEAELANSFHKKLVCMRVPGTTGAVPQILKKYDLIPFDPNSVLKQMED
jgi:MTH538 TIR-like domain (DUF1863)